MIACFIPTSSEAAWIKRKLKKHSHQKILLIQTGMGSKLARKAAQKTFSQFPISEVWIFGLAGALQKKLKCGDALLATHIGDETLGEKDWLPTDPTLFKWALNLLKEERKFEGSLVTVHKILSSAEEKIKFSSGENILGLEMEAFPIAQEAKARGIPFMEIRWVLDTLDYSLPDFGTTLQETGEIKVAAFIFHFLRHPRFFKEFAFFLPKVQKALQSMNRFLQKLISFEKVKNPKEKI